MLIEGDLEHFLDFYVVVLDEFSMNRAETRTQSGSRRGLRGRATAKPGGNGKEVVGRRVQPPLLGPVFEARDDE